MPSAMSAAGAPITQAESVPITLPAQAARSTARLARPRPISMIRPAHHLSSRKISETLVKNDSIRLPKETTVSPVVALGSAAAGPPCQMRSKLGAPIAIRLPTTQNGPVSAGSDQVPIVADIVAVITVQAIAPA